MLIQHLALHLPAILAAGGPVDNPAPSNPVSGNGIDLLISYAKYGALAACGLTGVISGGMIAFGQMSNRPEAADKGKRAPCGTNKPGKQRSQPVIRDNILGARHNVEERAIGIEEISAGGNRRYPCEIARLH